MDNVKKKEQRWLKLMELGARTGCHQIPQRSFYYREYQFPVCARCFGVFIGYLIGIPIYAMLGFGLIWTISLFCCACMLIDWLLQWVKILESTNSRRLLTGILGGFGLMVYYIKMYGILYHFVIHLIG